MGDLSVKAICMVLLVCFAAFVSTEVTLEKGGYNVLVSFSQNIKPTEGIHLLEETKESLEKASVILHTAIGLQFTKVTFKIPESWNISQLNVNIDNSGVSRNIKADFLIDGTTDVAFGKFPYAQQYGGCGIPGHQIIIPTAFFSDDNKFPKGTALAREWLKYRYGVFDENGYVNDILYPYSYVLPGDEPSERKVTDCTNSPITYNFTDETESFSLENNQAFARSVELHAVPEEESLENVTSSLMYFHQDIPGMQHVCGKNSDHQHNALSPNKQNAMCRSQSIWEVVKKSGDFQTEIVAEEYKDIEFIYAHERALKLVVAWENTKKIGKPKGKTILNAIKRFVYELPRGTQFNGFPFTNTLSTFKDYTLKELNDLNDKSAIMPKILSDFRDDTDGDVTIALSKALDILISDSTDSETEGTVIIISKSSVVLTSTLLERLQKASICVKFINLKERNDTDATQSYADLPCGSQELIDVDYSNEHVFNKLFDAMETVLPATVDDKSTETVTTGYLSIDTTIKFEVDDTAEKVTFWINPIMEAENFRIQFDEVDENLERMNVPTTDFMALSFYPKKPGAIEFSYPDSHDEIFTQVRVTSKAGQHLNGLIFVQDTSDILSTDQMPVIIYVAMRYGAYPVQNATVKAVFLRPNASAIMLELFDDGRGDPDITKNDGVYSRYFTQFSEKGVYSVYVLVETKDSTSFGIDENAGYRPCCGSLLETVQSKIPKSKNKKILTTTFTAKNGRPEKGYKPSRISDLRIDDVLDDKIILKWSAPGEEGDTGIVQSYEIKLYTSHEDAMNDTNGIILSYDITPLTRGGTEILELKFRDFKDHGRFYITVSAKNAEQTSDASPILEIFIGEDAVTTTDDGTGETTDDENSKTGGINRKTALIIGLIVGLILLSLLVFIVVFFVFLKPKRKEVAASSSAPNETERGENKVINPINFISADTIVRHHNEKTMAKMENKEPPIFTEADFEERHSSETSQSLDNANTHELENSNTNKEHLPPKSPKRNTFV